VIVSLATIQIILLVLIAWVFWLAGSERAEAAYVSGLFFMALIVCYFIVSMTLAVVSLI
jgi:hypothetical protein